MRITDLGIDSQLQQGAKAATPGGKGDDFANTLMDVLKEVNASQTNSTNMQSAFMAGQPVEYHDLMIAMQKASTTLQLTMQVRNQLLSAYQEIDKMAV
ncbi:MAG TPA: flagellar hook-basal body complex protein FliE [Fimbriimonadaceae bacterium]|jgi:flagellar hook-basal body complex protein FliE